MPCAKTRKDLYFKKMIELHDGEHLDAWISEHSACSLQCSGKIPNNSELCF